ncbi:MAG TPA: hypothetical protein VJU61_17640 [Polyangiaceae bacterium]|nr:hypothetical protein [Polyangiaceae bacterium]
MNVRGCAALPEFGSAESAANVRTLPRGPQAGAWLAAGSALLWAGLWLGCAPKVSAIPLGIGPLALAEQNATKEQARTTPPSASRPPPPTVAAAPLVSNSAADDAPEEPDEVAEEPSASAAEPSATAGNASAFVGLFAGKDVAIFRISGLPERQEVDDRAKIRIESDSPTELRVALINSENGSDLCELSAEVQGHSAVLDAGQPCFSSEGEGAISAELSSGVLVLQGDRLSMEAEGTLSVSLAEDQLDGELSYSFKGKRQ